MKERFLDAEQQARILARAAEFQAAHLEAKAQSASRVTLEDLEQAAQETGLDPQFVRMAAAAESEPRPLKKGLSLWSAATAFAICQFLACSALIYGEPTVTLSVGIPATIMLGIFASREKRLTFVSIALLLGSTLATVMTTLLWRRFVMWEPRLAIGTEDVYYQVFFSQALLFGVVAGISALVRSVRLDGSFYRRSSEPLK
ncbi:hypothetical protein EON81_12425 [bacterium]|nr:MAG: hypothetical protein EON81_12425 [bacterium]